MSSPQDGAGQQVSYFVVRVTRDFGASSFAWRRVNFDF
jgi:hypothetical protein